MLIITKWCSHPKIRLPVYKIEQDEIPLESTFESIKKLGVRLTVWQQ
jgi:hypothetical protein